MKVFSLLALILLISCSYQKSEQIDEVHLLQYSTREIQKKLEDTREYVSHCRSLSGKQKSSLIKFHEKSLTELGDLEQDLTRTKIILIKTLLESKVDTKIATMVRKEIKHLEKVKTDKTIDIYTEAQGMISPIKDIAVREHLYNAFMFKNHF